MSTNIKMSENYMKTKNNRYELAIFDMDGTILNTLDDLADSTNYALRQNNLPGRTIDEVRSFVGNGIRKLIERAVPAGSHEAVIQKVFDTFNDYYKDHCADKTREYEGISELVRKLKGRGIITAVVSNKADYGVQALCSDYFPGLFDYAVGEKEGVRRKPYPDSVNEVINRFNIPKEKAIYIGDSDVDYMTSVNAGIDVIMVCWGFRDEEFLREQGAGCFAHEMSDVYETVVYGCKYYEEAKKERKSFDNINSNEINSDKMYSNEINSDKMESNEINSDKIDSNEIKSDKMDSNEKNLDKKNLEYNFYDFCKVIEMLRAEDGCPWDREQTHASLKGACIEEAAEVVAGINIYDTTGNSDNLKEELGDLLLQVVMHAQIAKEEGLFDINDVISGIKEKMIRRHPHVFGEQSVDGSGEVLKNWEEIKKKEKCGKEWMEEYLPVAFHESKDYIDAAKKRKGFE